MLELWYREMADARAGGVSASLPDRSGIRGRRRSPRPRGRAIGRSLPRDRGGPAARVRGDTSSFFGFFDGDGFEVVIPIVAHEFFLAP